MKTKKKNCKMCKNNSKKKCDQIKTELSKKRKSQYSDVRLYVQEGRNYWFYINKKKLKIAKMINVYKEELR